MAKDEKSNKKNPSRKAKAKGKPFSKDNPSPLSISEAVERGNAAIEATKGIDPKKIDRKNINSLINTSVKYLERGMNGRTFNKKEKLEIAKLIASKSIPKDIHIGDKDGKSLSEMIKELAATKRKK